MKKKGYYIYFGSQGSSGVNKKISMQVKEMENFFQVDTIEVPKLERRFWKRLIGLLPWVSNNYDYNQLFNNLQNPDFIYTRAILVDGKYIKFLKKIKEYFPTCKIVLEYPTYPYDKEHVQLSEILFLFKDILFRRHLCKYVDRMVTYSQDETIFSTPAIKAINGIDVDSIEPIQPIEHADNEIHLIAVAMFQEYHGYERLIQGMADYYNENSENKKEIYLHMVGEGPEKDKYIQLVNKLKLEAYILFYGSKQGKELDELYNKADLAIASLGLYKININWLSALKTREYLSKGLPIVVGCRVDVLTNQFPYYIEFENKDTKIPINKVIDFYHNIYDSKYSRKEVIGDIRQFAKETVDMKVVMRPIIEYLDS